MIKKFGFENIRVFKDYQEFEIKPLTVLTGPNNSGKSTIGKVLRLLDEGFHEYGGKEKNMSIAELCFPDNLKNNIGNFTENLSRSSGKNFMGLSFITEDDVKVQLEYEKHIDDSEYKKYDKYNREALLKRLRISFKGQPILILGVKMTNLYTGTYSPDSIDHTLWHCEIDKSFSDNLRLALIQMKNKKLGELEQIKNIEPKLKSRVYLEIEKEIREKEQIFTELNYNKHNNLLIHTQLGDIVLSDKNFFDKNSHLDGYFLTIRKKLEELDIYNHSIFLEQYMNFEKELLFEIYKILFDKLSDSYVFNDDVNNLQLDMTDIVSLNSILKGETVDRLTGIDKKSLLESIENPLAVFFIADEWKQNIIYHRETTNHISVSENSDIIESMGRVLKEYLETIHNGIGYALKNKVVYYNQMFTSHDEFLERNNEDKNSVFYEFAVKYSAGLVYQENIKFINDWIKKLKIGDKFFIDDVKVSDKIIGYSFSIVKNNKHYLLSENGLGVRKLLEIMLKIALRQFKNLKGTGDTESEQLAKITNSKPHEYIYVLEEPESNLHPRFQSLLAEILVDAAWLFSVIFVVETHSEYFIRKLQFLVAKKKINPTDIKIYYFNQPDNIPKGEDQMRELSIREDGMMDEDFGPGFFDESIRLTLDLLKLQNRN